MARKTDGKNREQLVNDLQQKVTEHIQNLKDSGAWLHMLDYMARFHTYSLNNVILIMSQKPNASILAGYRQWTEHDRHVRKGEKGIKIFGYSTRIIKDQDGNPIINEETGEPERRAWFPIVSVFDISQTDPDDPEHDEYAETMRPFTPQDLEGEDTNGILPRATAWLESKGWTIGHEPMRGGMKGYTQAATRRIMLNEANSPRMNAKTILHEAAHAILATELGNTDHTTDYQDHRGLAETEAESTAYVVANILGLDTSEYSISYVAGWSEGKPETLRESAEHVLNASRIIADGIIDHDASR
ncbi:hypothetical protein BISA_2354 [Bifidobacterium saguini DSM 23967]|uniref:LtrC-like protein n=1 Tax=Bifidobacterium saguini DSM 23967 TaxID=1437607 RepID=A0A087D242_9BIFI|nr:ArdC-like ssDNA-binding domain-containing protein [Bifidobacterium saguini]KFI89592.1 hypothetical protein BISA_2354 [Bifidobacterium saguini DSM 23967]